MRNPAAPAARPTSSPAARRAQSPTEWVCIALALAIVALGCRLVSFW
jgi:hypothetical protein